MAITLRSTKGAELEYAEVDANFTTLQAADTTLAAADAAHAALTAAHGATGAVVGTTNAQTLTNKTLTSPVINTPTGIVKGDVGLGNVDNTSDANKPVSTATQTALNGKQTLDATLTALAGTLTAANKIPYATALDTAGELDFKDEDNMASDSATAVPSQQSTKAYADTKNIATQVAPTTAGNVLFTADGAAWTSSPKIASGTAIATTSGTAHDFTGIPATAKRITVMISGLSTNGTSVPIIQLGDSGGIENTGYSSAATNVFTTTPTTSNFTTGFGLESAGSASAIIHGSCVLTLLDSATNLWSVTGTLVRSDAAATSTLGGSKALSATLTQIRLTTVNGTDAFDAGSVNILYE